MSMVCDKVLETCIDSESELFCITLIWARAYRYFIANCFNLLHQSKSNENVYSWHCIDVAQPTTRTRSHQSINGTEEIVSTCEHNAPIQIDAKTYHRKIHLVDIMCKPATSTFVPLLIMHWLFLAHRFERSVFPYFSLTNVHGFKYL